MTMSLTLEPDTSFSRLMLSSDVDRMANRRCAVIVRFQGVDGAGLVGSTTRFSFDSPSASFDPRDSAALARAANALVLVKPLASASCFTRRICTRKLASGFAIERAVIVSKSIADGTASPSHGIGTRSGCPSGVESVNKLSMMTPAAPSTVAWWNLVRSAHRPSASPSMT